jgi:hypothetical protein
MPPSPLRQRLLVPLTLGLALVGGLATPPLADAAAEPSAAPALGGESRSVEPFEAVVVRGRVDLVLQPAAAPAVRVEAGPADAQGLELRVVRRDGRPTLEIDQRGPRSRSGSPPAPKVTVGWTNLAALTLQGSGSTRVNGLSTPAFRLRMQGSGDVVLDGVQTRSLAVSLAGSGDLKARGRADALSISLAGSGDVDAASLEAEAVSVSLAGSGDVSVQATRTLGASVAGSGTLRYEGSPQVTSQVAGSGRVVRRE